MFATYALLSGLQWFVYTQGKFFFFTFFTSQDYIFRSNLCALSAHYVWSTTSGRNGQKKAAHELSERVDDALSQRPLHSVIVVVVTGCPARTVEYRVEHRRERKHAEECGVHVTWVLVALDTAVLAEQPRVEFRRKNAARDVDAFDTAKHCRRQKICKEHHQSINLIIIIHVNPMPQCSRCLGYLHPHNPQGQNVAVPALF